MGATILIRMGSFWKALSRQIMYLVEDDNIWWFNMDYRLERQRNSEMIFHGRVECGVQCEGSPLEELEGNSGAESIMQGFG